MHKIFRYYTRVEEQVP